MKYQFSAVIVVDSAIVAAGLSYIINKTNNFRILGLYSGYAELLRRTSVQNVHPSVIIIDSRILLENNRECLLYLRKNYTSANILAIHPDEMSESSILALKENDIENMPLSTPIAHLTEHLASLSEGATRYSKRIPGNIQLTTKEKEFIGLICSNLTYKEIADIMGISKRTVDTHRDNLFVKFNINSRSALISHAIDLGLIVNMA
jgi:two-component system invasion response regulator UvrY